MPMLPSVPEAVYRNPKIGLVYLRAHQDVEGRLLGPQIMYQIVDPGGWNTEAVEQGRGYIPAANQEGAPRAGMGRRWPRPESSRRWRISSPLLDPAAATDIVITGLMRPEDKPEAEETRPQARSGRHG